MSRFHGGMVILFAALSLSPAWAEDDDDGFLGIGDGKPGIFGIGDNRKGAFGIGDDKAGAFGIGEGDENSGRRVRHWRDPGGDRRRASDTRALYRAYERADAEADRLERERNDIPEGTRAWRSTDRSADRARAKADALWRATRRAQGREERNEKGVAGIGDDKPGILGIGDDEPGVFGIGDNKPGAFGLGEEED